MTRLRITALIVGFQLLALSPILADAFNLQQTLKKEPHVFLKLTPEQITQIGKERKLVPTGAQREMLLPYARSLPKAVGISGAHEMDCSCCISTVMWTANDQAVVWTSRLVHDKKVGERNYKFYKEKKNKCYTSDVHGQIYKAGRPISWQEFEMAVLKKEEREYLMLSLPPQPPKDFLERVQNLREKKSFSLK